MMMFYRFPASICNEFDATARGCPSFNPSSDKIWFSIVDSYRVFVFLAVLGHTELVMLRSVKLSAACVGVHGVPLCGVALVPGPMIEFFGYP